jgi:hypothetical protein
VSGYVSNDDVTDDSMMPDALLLRGYSKHAYLILLGTLIGQIPTVLDSLLVRLKFI